MHNKQCTHNRLQCGTMCAVPTKKRLVCLKWDKFIERPTERDRRCFSSDSGNSLKMLIHDFRDTLFDFSFAPLERLSCAARFKLIFAISTPVQCHHEACQPVIRKSGQAIFGRQSQAKWLTFDFRLLEQYYANKRLCACIHVQCVFFKEPNEMKSITWSNKLCIINSP